MKKAIRLTERDLARIVRRVIKENDLGSPTPEKDSFEDHLQKVLKEVGDNGSESIYLGLNSALYRILEDYNYDQMELNEDMSHQDQTRHSENKSLKFMQDEIDKIADESYDINDFDEMIEEFYNKFEEELNNLSDSDYRTLEDYIDDTLSNIRMSDYGDKDHYRGW